MNKDKADRAYRKAENKATGVYERTVSPLIVARRAAIENAMRVYVEAKHAALMVQDAAINRAWDEYNLASKDARDAYEAAMKPARDTYFEATT